MRAPSPEREIRQIPPLDLGQAAVLEHHSTLNVLNVLARELKALGIALANRPDLLQTSIALCYQVAEQLRDPRRSARWVSAAEAFAESIESAVAGLVTPEPQHASEPTVQSGIRSLRSALAILRSRVAELRHRTEDPWRWEHFQPEALCESVAEVLTAMERHSRGRFRVVYSPELKTATDYCLEMEFHSDSGELIHMPPAVVDVVRDLVANARKYTPPGGEIRVTVIQTRYELEVSVQDTGRGIPETELERVVAFGCRGSNVTDVPTCGGGFGLTKAFEVTRRFGGRFWIASEPEVGTRVRLTLPTPDCSRN